MDYTGDRYAVYVLPNWRVYATFARIEAARNYVAYHGAFQVEACIWDRLTRSWCVLDR